MLIDARTAQTPDAIYRPLTVRLALWEAMQQHLHPNRSLKITRALDADGHTVPVRSLQITAAQITPATWKVFTERDAEGGLTLYRWS